MTTAEVPRSLSITQGISDILGGGVPQRASGDVDRFLAPCGDPAPADYVRGRRHG